MAKAYLFPDPGDKPEVWADADGDDRIVVTFGGLNVYLSEAAFDGLLAAVEAFAADRSLAAAWAARAPVGGGEAPASALQVEPAPTPETFGEDGGAGSCAGNGTAVLPDALPLDDERALVTIAAQIELGDRVGWAINEGIVNAADEDRPPVDWWLPVIGMKKAGAEVLVTVDHDGVAHDYVTVGRAQPVLVRRAP